MNSPNPKICLMSPNAIYLYAVYDYDLFPLCLLRIVYFSFSVSSLDSNSRLSCTVCSNKISLLHSEDIVMTL